MNAKRRENALKLLETIKNHRGFKDNNGRTIAIQDINDRNRFAVLASAGGSYYEVLKLKIGYTCNCYDYVNKCTFIEGLQCKHVQLIRILKEEQKRRLPKGVLKL